MPVQTTAEMVGLRALVSIGVIILLAAALGYVVGRVSTSEEPVSTTTTTSITTTTQTAIAYVTVTERKTTTITTTLSTDVREPPRTLPPPANSSAVIRGYLLLNGSIFVILSIDKPVYSLGGDMHVKGTVTNLTPDDVTIRIDNALIWVENITGATVWIYPESNAAVIIGPPTIDSINIGRGETVQINLATVDWNLTGVHTVTTKESNIINIRAVYDEKPLPQGEYRLVWWPRFTLWEGPQMNRIEDTIPFTITR
ncbi:MAG: hypothetical protein M1503_01510 [Thaumarchaeota archaeon]|nr:hypothetical protein [Nitrososphaerota archaeon]MCL5316933.1 hypothetical protein [Nitrososphaerota archaeon]